MASWDVSPARPATVVLPPRGAQAPLADRLPAGLVDLVIMVCAAAPVALGVATSLGQLHVPTASVVLVAAGGLVSLVVGLLQVWWEGVRGATVGKRFCHVMVVDARRGRPLGFWRALLRGIVRGLPLVVFSVLLRTDRRGWHDLAVGSVVVETLPPGPRDAVRSPQQRVHDVSYAPGARPPAPVSSVPMPCGPPSEPPSGDGPGSSSVPRGPGRDERPLGPVPVDVYGAPTGSVPVVRPGSLPPVPGPPRTGAVMRAERDLPAQSAIPVASPTPAEGVLPPVPTPPPAATWSPGDGHHEQSVLADPVPTSLEAASVANSASGARGEDTDGHAEGALGGFVADDFGEETRIAAPRRPRSDGPRAVLELSDGREVVMTATVLLGRHPTQTPDRPVKELVTVPDPGRSLSKSHLIFGVDGDGVWLADQHSTNGTVVTLVDGQQIIAAPEQVVRLPEDAVVSAGDLTVRARFEAPTRELR